MMIAAPIAAMPTASAGSAAPATAASMSEEDMDRLAKKLQAKMSGSAGSAAQVGCGSGGAAAGAGGENSTCEDLRRLRKDVDDLTAQISGLTRAVEVLVNQKGQPGN
jgi:hypothetical protein